MAASSLVRSVVRATHRWPLLGSVYRSIYRAAAGSVARLASREPAITGVYARNSYALGTWEAGRSDIDLTLVWRDAPESSIAAFYRSYADLVKRYPMLGEVEMIHERNLPAWSAYGATGLESRCWKKLAGSHTFQCRYAGSEPLDRLRHAVSIYRYQFLPRVWNPRESPVTLYRLAAKILRQFGAPPPAPGAPADLLEQSMAALSRAVRQLPLPQQEPLVDYEALLEHRPVSLPRTAGSGAFPVIALAGSTKARHVLAFSGLRPEFTDATIMDGDLFRFYLTFVDPLEYLELLRGRTILQGEDPLRERWPLSRRALRETVCAYAVDMLTFPYRSHVASIPDREFRDLLYGWFLRTLRYFETGVFTFDYGRLREYFGARHAEDLPRFPLLCAIAAELSDHMLAGAGSR